MAMIGPIPVSILDSVMPGDPEVNLPVCPVCGEEIEDGDGTEQGGEFVHFICLGEMDE